MSAARSPARPAASATQRQRAAALSPTLTPAFTPTRTPISLAMCLLVVSPLGFALPTGPVNTSGQTTVQTTTPGQMLIQQSTAKAALDWTSFSIAAGEKVQVVQPDRTSVLLNRVVGENPSLIYGALQSNGGVWLINPRGIVFGAGSRVDVGSLVASTLGISNDAMQSGRLQLGAGAGGAGELRSEGHISAIDGSVVLVAPHLVHGGQIEARRVGLAAASEVLVDVEGDGLIFFNVKNEALDARLQVLGGVRADGGLAEFRAVARAGFADTVLNLDGVVQARSLGQRQGRIVVDGGANGITRVGGSLQATAAEGGGGDVLVQGEKILLTGTAQVDTSGAAGGGRLRVGGGFQGNDDSVRNAGMVSVAPGARLTANAIAQGDGGELIIWSDRATRFLGRADSRGGAHGGNGGLVEVSGKAYLDFRGSSDRSAPRGQAGLLLLDPTDLEIVLDTPNINGDGTTGDDLTSGLLDFAAPGALSRITAAAVVVQLRAGDVVLQALGKIDVNSAITSDSANALTLQAAKNITIGAAISANGSITLSANDAAAPSDRDPAAIVRLNQAVSSAGTLTITNNGGTGVHIVAANLTAANLSVTGGIDIADRSEWSLSGTQVLLNAVTGEASLKISGTGVLTLSGASGYTGALSVTRGGLNLSGALGSTTIGLNGGNLTTAAANLLADTANVTVTSGTLTLGGADTIATLSLGGTVAAGGILTTSGTTTLTAGGIVNAALNANALTVTGSATVNGIATVTNTAEVTGGTLTLNSALGTNTVTLGTAGNLTTTAADLLADTATVTVGSSSTLTLGGNDTITRLALAGTVAGSGALTTTSLTANGTAAQISSAVSTGDATVQSGVLTVGNGGAGSLAASGTLAVDSGAVLAYNRNTSTTLNINVAGAGTLRFTGGAVVEFNANANSLSALEVTGSGTHLRLSDGDGTRVGNGTTITVGAGAVLTLGNRAETVGLLDLTGTVTGSDTLTAGSYTLRPGALVSTSLGNGNLAVSGSGTATLNAAKGTGSITVDGGATLQLGASANLNANSNVTVQGTGTLILGANDSIDNLTLAGTLSGAFTLNANGSTTLQTGGVVAAGTAVSGGTLTVSGDATLNGTSTHGAVNIGSSGVLRLGSAERLNNGATVTNNGLLTLAGDETIDVYGGTGVLEENGFSLLTQTTTLTSSVTNVTASTLIIAGDVRIRGIANVSLNTLIQSGFTLTVGNAAGDDGVLNVTGTTSVASGATLSYERNGASAITLAGNFAGDGIFRNDGSSPLNITGTLNTLNVQLNGGNITLATGSNDRLRDTANVAVAAGRTLTVNNVSETVGALTLFGTLAGTGVLQATTASVPGGASGNLNTALNAATLNISGALATNAADRIGNTNNVNVLSGGSLTLGGNDQIAALTVAGAISPTTGGTFTLSASSGTLSNGALVNAGLNLSVPTLSVTGNGTLNGTLSGATQLTLNGGVLTLGGSGRLAAATDVIINGTVGSGLTLGGTETVASFSSAGILGGNTARLNVSSPITLNAGAVVNAELGGTTLNVNGNATLNRLTTAGSVNVSGGAQFTLGAANLLAGTANVSVSTGGTLALSGTNGVATLSLGGNLTGSTLTTSGTTTLTDGATVNGGLNANALVASGVVGSNTAINTPITAGTTTVTGGTLTLGGALASNTVTLSGGNLVTSATNLLADTANLSVNTGSTLTLGGTDTIATLSLGGNLAAGSTLSTSATTTLTNGATVNGGLNANALVASGAVGSTTAINTAITAGTATVTGGTLTLGGALTANTITLSGGNLTTTATNLLADTADVIVTSGTLTLGGADTITALTLGGGALAGSLLTVSGAMTATVDGGLPANLASAGSLMVTSGTLSVSAEVPTNTIRLAGGNLVTSATNLLRDAAAVSLGIGSTLTLGGADTIAALTLSGGALVGGLLTVSGAVTSTVTGSLPSTLATAGSLVVTGGTLTASAVLPTNTISLTGGNLTTTTTDRLRDAASVTVSTGSTLTLGGADTITTLSLGGTLAAGGALTTSGTTTLTAGGIVNAALNANALTVTGNATITGIAAVTNTAEVSGGTLTVNSLLGANIITLSGGNLTTTATNLLADSASLSVAAGSTLTLGGPDTIAALSLGGGVLAGSALTLSVTGAVTATANGSLSSTLASAGSLVVTGGTLSTSAPVPTNTISLTGGNLSTGLADLLLNTANVTVNTGSTLTLGGADTIATLSLGGNLAAGGTLTTSGTTTLSNGATVNGGLNATNALTSSGSTAINTAVTAGTTTVTGGTLTLAGVLTSNAVTLNGANLVTTATNLLADAANLVVNTGSTLTLGGTDTIATLLLGGNLAGSGTLTTSGTTTLSNGATVNGGLNANALIASGTAVSNTAVNTAITAGTTTVAGGTLTLGGALTSNTVTLSGGNLTTTAANLLADAASLSVVTGNTLTLGGADTVATLLLGGNLAGSGTLTTSGTTTLTNGATVNGRLNANALIASGTAVSNTAINTAITAGTATVTGGTLTLGGALASNIVNLNGGNLNTSAANLLADSAAVSVATGSTLRLGGADTIASLALGGNLAAGSTLTTSGTTTLSNGATVNGGLSANALASSGTTAINSAVGAGTTSVTGGTLTLGGALTSNTITLSGGSLTTSATNLLDDAASLSVATGSTLTLGGADTVATLSLGGTLATGGTLTTSGTTTLTAGGIVNAALNANALTVTGNATLNGIASVINTAAITGGTLTLAGAAGALVSDTVLLNGGNLTTSAANRLADTANVTVNSGSTLSLGGAETVATLTLAGTLAGSGNTLTASAYTLQSGASVLANLGLGTLTSSGNAQLVGTAAANTVNVDGGVLTLGAPERVSNTAAVTVASGATLFITGIETVGSVVLSGVLSGTSGSSLNAGTYQLAGGTSNIGLGGGTFITTSDSKLNAPIGVTSLIVQSGTLQFGLAGLLTATPALTINSGATLLLGGNETAASLTLSGTLGSTGAATNTLTAASYNLNGGTVNTALGAGTLTSVGNSLLAATSAATSVSVNVNSGGGTLTLTSDGSFSAAPSVNLAATSSLVLGSGQVFGSLAGSGNLALGSFTLSTGSGGPSTFAGAISGSGGVVKQGNTTFTLGGSHSYGGGTLVALGTLALQNDNVLPDGSAVTVNAGATLALGGIDTVASLALAGTLGGAGTLTASAGYGFSAGAATLANANLGSGTVTVNGSSSLGGTAAGDVVLNTGTLSLAAADRLADSASVTVLGPATLLLAGADTVSSLSLAGRLAGTGQTLTATTVSTLQAGAIVDANFGGATLNVAGSAALNGTAGHDTININSGTLTLGSAERLRDNAALVVGSGSTLLLGGTETVGTLALAGTLAGTLGSSGRLLNAATYTLQAGASALADLGTGTLTSTGNATLSGTAAANTVNVNNGTLSLASANRLADTATVSVASGATLMLNGDDTVFRLALSGVLGGTGTLSASIYTLSGGTYNTPLGGGDLTVSANSTLNATSAAATVTVDGGTLTLGAANRFTATPAVTVNTGAGLTLGGAENFGSLAGAGTVALGSFTLTHLGLADSTFSGNLGATGSSADSGGLVKTGNSNFTVNGTGRYTGNTLVQAGTLTVAGTLASLSFDVNGGSLVLGGPDRLADVATVVVRNGALMTLAGNDSIASLVLTGTLGGSGTLSANLVALDTGTVTASLGGGTLTSTGISLLSGTSAATALAVNGGRLTLAGANRLTGTPVTTVASGTTLAMQGGLTLGSLTGGGNVNLDNFTLTTGSAGDSAYNGVLSGTGGLTKTGTSVFTLGGGNSYSGATQVLAGTLATSAADVLPNSTALTVASGATLALGLAPGGIDSVGSLMLAGTLTGTGTLAAATYALSGGSANIALGAGVLTSTGSSSLAATSAASTVTVAGGTLTLAAPNLLADSAALSVASGATLALGGNDSVASLALAGTLAGTGTLTASSYSLNSATVDANLGAGTLASSGNTTLAGSAGAGVVQISAGTLSLASAGRLADTAQVAVASGATLRLNGDDSIDSLALAGTLEGSGRLSAATITLSGGTAEADVGATTLNSSGNSRLAGGANVGAVNVAGGTLALAGTATLSATSATTVAAGAVLELGGNQSLGTLAGAGNVALRGFTLTTGSGGSSSFDGVISGTGGLSKAGSGTFTLGGANNYTGATSVLTGTLATARADVLPDASATRVASGATLQLGGSDTVATLLLNGVLQGNAASSATLTAATYTLDGGNAVANLGAGRLVSTGSSTLAGTAAAADVAVNGGTLVLAAANRLSDSANVAIVTGARLQLGGDDTIARADIAGTLAGSGTLSAATVALAGGRVDTALGGGVLSSSGRSQLNATSAATVVNVDGGELTLGAAQRLRAAPSLTLAAGSRMVMAGDETLGSLAGAGDLTLNTTTLRTGSSNDSSYAGSITGSGRLVKQGSGVFTLSGAHAYSGSTTIEAGTLALAAADRLPDGSAVAVATGATLALAGNETVASLALNGTLAAAAGNAATLSAASYVLDGGNAIATLGTGNLQSSGASRLGGSSAATTVLVNGGTLALAAADRLADSAAVSVASGATLTLAGNDSIANLALAGTLAGNGTLTAASYSLNSGTVIADLGTGVLRSAGSSRLNGRSAATTLTVDGGSLVLGAADRLADSMAVSVASGAGLVINATDAVASITLAGTLSGSGTLTATNTLLDGGRADANLGAGTLTSRGSSTLAGTAAATTVVVDGGTLTLASAQRLVALPALQVNSGANLVFGGDQALGSLAGAGNVALASFTLTAGSGGDSIFAGVIGGSGGLVKQGSSSVFTLTGANSYTGVTRINAGTLRVGNGGTSGSLASSAFETSGTLSMVRSDNVTLAQPVSGSGSVEQAGNGRLLFSGNNKTYGGDTLVTRGELATAGADELPDGSSVRVAAPGRLALGGRETVRAVDADGSISLGPELVASADLLMRGAVSSAGAVQLTGRRIAALNEGNRFGGAVSISASGELSLSSGKAGAGGGAGSGAGGGTVARDLVLGTVSVAAGGRVDAGLLSLTGATTVTGGTLSLVAAAPLTAVAPDAELSTRQATSLPIAFAADAVVADTGGRLNIVAGAGLSVIASNGGSVQLLATGNSFLGNVSVVSGSPDTPWSTNSTALSFGGTTLNYAMQSRVRMAGNTVTIGGAGVVADVVSIRADRMSTTGTAAIVARLPFDSTAGAATALPGLTLELTPAAFALSFPFGAPGAEGGLRVSVGSRDYGNRVLPLDAGYVAVLPRDGASGTTAVLLRGPVVNPSGGYRFFFTGAGSQTQIPVFYNGVLPTTPQVENSISATVAVSEGARKAGFDDAVRTENVAVRLRAGVIAEVGPAPSATQGTEGLRVPAGCTPAPAALLCGSGS